MNQESNLRDGPTLAVQALLDLGIWAIPLSSRIERAHETVGGTGGVYIAAPALRSLDALADGEWKSFADGLWGIVDNMDSQTDQRPYVGILRRADGLDAVVYGVYPSLRSVLVLLLE